MTDDSSIQNDSPIFRMLAIENFLGEVETHLHKIHQGYLKTTEQLDTIRGSVTGTSLMMLDAGVSLKPRCRYNKFVPNIPLYQVLVTTLDAIHRGWCIPNDPILKHLDIIKKTKHKPKITHQTPTHHQFTTRSRPQYLSKTTSQSVATVLGAICQPVEDFVAKQACIHEPICTSNGGYMWLVNTSKFGKVFWHNPFEHKYRSLMFDQSQRKQSWTMGNWVITRG